MIEVLDIRLKNFARIATGLQVTDLYVDFEKLTNDFYLFIGKNGTGKTSILHTIHPFAYNSSIGDSVPNSEFIVSGQDGEKNIRYRIDNDIYDIRHMYLRKNDGSISVKSFISKNGDELNSSGTVSTFKDIINEIFELDETYLSLLSLGNTVSGFVDYTGGDRKQLVTKIFTKLNIFGRYYKNASAEARNLKSVLNNVTAKLDRYNGYDIDEAKRTVIQIEKKMEELTEKVEELSTKIGGMSQKILSNKEFLEEYQSKRDKLLKLLEYIETLKGRIQTQKDIPSLENDLKDICAKIESQRINFSSFELNLKTSLDYVQSLKVDLEDTESMLNRMTGDVDLTELDTTKANIEAKLAQIDLPDNVPKLDKDKLVRANIFLEELKGLCIEFVTDIRHEEIVTETAAKYLEDASLLSKSEEKYNGLVLELQRSNYFKHTNLFIDGLDKFEVKDNGCDKVGDCPYFQFYNHYRNIVSMKTGEIDNEIARRKSEIDLAKDIVEIGRIVSRLTGYIKRNAEILDLPIEIFNPKTFVSLYMEKREVFDVDLMSSLIDIAEKQCLKNELLIQLQEVETKRKNHESLRENFNTLEKRIDSLKGKMESSKSSIDYYRNELPLIEEEIKRLEDTKSKIEKAIEAAKELEKSRSEISELRIQISAMESKSSEIEHLQFEISSLTKTKSDIGNELAILQKQKEEINLKIQTIAGLEREQFTLMEQYSDAESIRNAVSPAKGIPLEYIKKYIKGDLIQMVNELLELVYHGELSIDPRRVIIDETEFTIPYRRRGTLISDISQASDGERAVMSLAFSLSLARITSKRYNILLLDEMDTSLDSYSRGKYIDMIVAYMKLIKCHQVFLISHNSMFDNYPVNVLMTSDMSVSNIKKSNILKLWESKTKESA